MTVQRIEKECVTDSRMALDEALAGTAAPPEVLIFLRLLDVSYYSFDGRLHRGQLVVHEAVEGEVREVFRLIERLRFPVARVIPIVRYRWSDESSMADNNSSAFNYRFVGGTERLSHHAQGRAVDINPRSNPVLYGDGRTDPPGALYDPDGPGALTEASPVVKAFLNRGWRWGGHFRSLKDYHHFEKP